VGLDFAFDMQAHRALRPHRVRRYPTDGSFTSSCFPPHLTVTQFLSVSRRRAYPWRGLSPLWPFALSGAHVAGLRQLCFYSASFTHNLRCGLEECRQLRWLVVSKNHPVRALEASS